MKPSAEYIRSRLHYEPETGVFTWLAKPDVDRWSRIWNTRYAGKKAGNYNPSTGYVHLRVGSRKSYLAHRIAYLYMTEDFPTFEIDHRDLNGMNNSWDNIREATSSQNSMNKSKRRGTESGFKGVTRNHDRWTARIMVEGKSSCIGTYDSPEEAAAAYGRLSQSLHHDFGRTE